MAQIAITLAPALSVELTLTGMGSTVTVGKPTPVVGTALFEMMRGPKGNKGDDGAADLVADPLAYYILAKA